MKEVVGISLVAMLGFVGCTEPGETTQYSAAAGGVLGAGLGAIIGSQGGDAGTGLVIGGLAGAGTGAAVGNALEAQQEAIRTQDEALERQEKMIRAQGAELKELRRSASDRGVVDRAAAETENRISDSSFGAPGSDRSLTSGRARYGFNNSADQARLNAKAEQVDAARRAAARSGRGLTERSLDTSAVEARLNRAEARLQEPKESASPRSETVDPQRLSAQPALSADCQQAMDESRRAEESHESSQKLFHLRRALRLCPDEAKLHNNLGEVYLKLNRSDDASFEFREALRLNPGLGEARSNLERIKSGRSY